MICKACAFNRPMVSFTEVHYKYLFQEVRVRSFQVPYETVNTQVNTKNNVAADISNS